MKPHHPADESAAPETASLPAHMAVVFFQAMKATALLLAAATLFLVGCRFKAPLVKEDTLPIDPAVIGLWEPLPEHGKKAEADKRMVILKFSDTEYMVRQPIGDGVIHYRAYPVELGGIRCVQLEAIGDAKGPLGGGKDIATPFQVVSYKMEGWKLVIRTLNTELFPDTLDTTQALQDAFLAYKDRKDLFTNPQSYRKVEGE